MRHVMALRVSKVVLVFAIALFYTILVLNNITDYGSNYEFVRHVLMMDSTFPGNHGMWRAVNSPLVHTVFYIGIIAWESVTMLLCWWAGVRLLNSYCGDRAQFAAALNVAVVALTTSLLMWLVAFLDVRRMVSDVAVAYMEWAGRGIPNVYYCRYGVFGGGATRANSRLVGYSEVVFVLLLVLRPSVTRIAVDEPPGRHKRRLGGQAIQQGRRLGRRFVVEQPGHGDRAINYKGRAHRRPSLIRSFTFNPPSDRPVASF